jgi:hypothetical protein
MTALELSLYTISLVPILMSIVVILMADSERRERSRAKRGANLEIDTTRFEDLRTRSSQVKITGPEGIVCPKCHRVYETMEDLRRHMDIVTSHSHTIVLTE